MSQVQRPEISEVEFKKIRHQSFASKSPTKKTCTEVHQLNQLQLLQRQMHTRINDQYLPLQSPKTQPRNKPAGFCSVMWLTRHVYFKRRTYLTMSFRHKRSRCKNWLFSAQHRILLFLLFRRAQEVNRARNNITRCKSRQR